LIKANGFNPKIVLFFTQYHCCSIIYCWCISCSYGSFFWKTAFKVGIFLFWFWTLHLRYYNWSPLRVEREQGLLLSNLLLPKLSLNAHTIELRTYLGLLEKYSAAHKSAQTPIALLSYQLVRPLHSINHGSGPNLVPFLRFI
jgi:hypothetical protein